jgi:hypothetical protein
MATTGYNPASEYLRQIQNQIPETKRERPTDALSSAISGLRNVRNDLGDVADQLCGHRPPEPTAGGTAARMDPAGMFEAVTSSAEDINEIAAQLASEIKRIRNKM